MKWLRVNGSPTEYHALMQAIADLMQIEVDVATADRAGPLGAGALTRSPWIRPSI